jgi:8-oxo-dGTP pyrophosphatase MutT (NUDIX family)
MGRRPSGGRARRPAAGLQILSRRRLHEGFLVLELLRARHRRKGGKTSPPYVIEVMHRRGVDCVSATLWFRRRDGKIFVGVRRALRASMASRAALKTPLPEKPRAWFWEAVAGGCEPGDRGMAGLRRRMRREILEETGIRVPSGRLRSLGAGFFPSHGQSTEKIHMFEAEVSPRPLRGAPQAEGERGEEGATLHFVELDEAIRRCVKGVYEDPKLEIGFRRLREKLNVRPGINRPSAEPR